MSAFIFKFRPLILGLSLSNALFAQESNAKIDYSAYLPQLHEFNRQLASSHPAASLLTKSGLETQRRMFSPDTRFKPSVTPFEKTVGIGTNKITLRIFKPDTVKAVILQIHGGGWCLGTAAFDDPLNHLKARTCQVAVVGINYRLAPEFPFPACIEDCGLAAKWLIANAQAEFGTTNIFISGYSAGAHLAALTTLYIRDSLHAISNVKGVTLEYGCFDLSGTPSFRQASDSTLVLKRKDLDEDMQLVFPGWSAEQLRNPEFSPLYANLRNLPPALFTVGTADFLLDDTYFMEARWRNAGNRTFLAVYPDCPHGFTLMPTLMAECANRTICEWIISNIERTSPPGTSK